MSTYEIKKLIDLYYDGKTNHDEESILLTYFKGDKVADDLLEEQALFLQLHNREEKINIPQNLSKDLNSLIDNLAEQTEDKSPKKQSLQFTWAAIAASVAILLSVSINLSNDTEISKSAYSEIYKIHKQTTSPEYIEAEKAMMLFANNFNKGMIQLNEATENIDKAQDIIDQLFKTENKN